MTKKALWQPLSVFFSAAQAGLRPLRRAGVMGTADRPRYFAAGDAVPWWIFCRWPMNLPLVFECDCESYFEGGLQVVRPLWQARASVIAAGDQTRNWVALIVGAPTCIDTFPRPGRPALKRPGRVALEGA